MTAHPLRILLISGGPDALEVARRHLAGEFPDQEIQWVDDTRSFAHALEGPAPDVAIADQRLGFADRGELVRRYRERHPEVPVILLTEPGAEEEAARAVREGLDDYVVRSPEHLVRLATSVQKCLERAGERRWRRSAESQIELFRRQLARAQRLEALGRFAGGIAHDFNNLLTVVGGHLELLGLELVDEQRSSESFREIESALASAARLTRQLLIFSRHQHLRTQVVELGETVEGVLSMLRRTLEEDLEIELEPWPEPLPVEVDPAQLEQVVVELAVNARDAMPGGGRLRLTTSLQTRSASEGEPARKLVCLEVTDTGSGMDASTLERIFDPFYTTKKAGEGTGLGLSTVYGFVSQSGGVVEVESQPGSGSTFRILLPRSDSTAIGRERPPEPAGAPEEPAGRPPRHTILVVEDQRSLRDLIARTLRREGYEVLTAAGGGEALELLSEPDRRVDLLLTDVVMPEMDGPQLLEHLRGDRRRAPRALFMSGYAGGTESRYPGLDPGMPFLPKPFTPAQLIRLVTEILGRDDA